LFNDGFEIADYIDELIILLPAISKLRWCDECKIESINDRLFNLYNDILKLPKTMDEISENPINAYNNIRTLIEVDESISDDLKTELYNMLDERG